jgi:hypothetical protein
MNSNLIADEKHAIDLLVEYKADLKILKLAIPFLYAGVYSVL